MTVRKKHTNGILNPHIIFMVTNTCLSVIEWCLEVIGTGRVVQSRSYSKDHPRRMPAYKYVLDTNAYLVQLLPQILGHLKVKKRQAELTMIYLNSRSGKYRGNYSRAESDILFNLRHANLKDYDLLGSPTIRYRGRNYNKDEFSNLFFERRDESGNQYVEWTTEMDSILGTDIDSNIAGRLGLKLASVQRRRTNLRVPPYGSLLNKKSMVIQLRSEGLTLKNISSKVGISKSSVVRILDEVVY